MNETQILLSRLASEQLAHLPPSRGRAMVHALRRLAVFPESAARLSEEGYEAYRQLIAQGYRAIYRYFPDNDQVRVYCLLRMRRQLPPSEFLIYQLF